MNTRTRATQNAFPTWCDEGVPNWEPEAYAFHNMGNAQYRDGTVVGAEYWSHPMWLGPGHNYKSAGGGRHNAGTGPSDPQSGQWGLYHPFQ